MESFVSEDKQKFLLDNGWIKMYESFDKVKVSEIYKDGIRASQTWSKYSKENIRELIISYEDGGLHNCQLYFSLSDKSAEIFKLRMIKSQFKKFGLIKETL